ncbi:hypothetical protein [Brucella intermedia]|uniref:hypothetical protein n=1 Tax=Brucella intermedia TaxID=94625 RepID=UPI00165D1EE3|nr:hypothetical protein [Brucella intermedia]QNQ40597.1 hypothetical protein IAR37_01820 [Brucella intermedia]
MLSSDTVTKLGKLIPRLASDHDGEVVATARAIVRSLNSAGADLHDVVAAIDKPPVERVVFKDRVIYRDRPVEKPAPTPVVEPKPEPEYDTSMKWKEVVEYSERLLNINLYILNSKEAQFVRHMMNSAQRRKSRFRMTVRQAEWFRSIMDEHFDDIPDGGAA